MGAGCILVGIAVQFYQWYKAFRDRELNPDVTGDPWNGHTLEWSTSSPPQFYNFAELPVVEDIDAFTDMKEKGTAYQAKTCINRSTCRKTPVPVC